MADESMFVIEGEGFRPTESAVGPWSRDLCQGSAYGGLLIRALERHEAAARMTLARMTFDFWRPVTRVAEGDLLRPGPAAAWFHLLRPLVAGEENSPLIHVVSAADLVAGISAVVELRKWSFVNPDLTIALWRTARRRGSCCRQKPTSVLRATAWRAGSCSTPAARSARVRPRSSSSRRVERRRGRRPVSAGARHRGDGDRARRGGRRQAG